MRENFAETVVSESKSDGSIQVVLMLYDGAINFLNKAVAYAKDGKDLKKKNLYTQKANEIIVGLDGILDSESGGDVTKNLKLLYAFMNRHLVDAAANGSTKGLTDVIQMLSELRESWQFVDQSMSASAA